MPYGPYSQYSGTELMARAKESKTGDSGEPFMTHFISVAVIFRSKTDGVGCFIQFISFTFLNVQGFPEPGGDDSCFIQQKAADT